MTPERGPLPPMVFPLSDEGREIYVPQRIKKWAQDYAIAYAAAEVARLAGQAVAWQWKSRQEWYDSLTQDERYHFNEDGRGYKRDLGAAAWEASRALGVIATPSAETKEKS